MASRLSCETCSESRVDITLQSNSLAMAVFIVLQAGFPGAQPRYGKHRNTRFLRLGGRR